MEGAVVPAPTDVKGLVSATTQLVQDLNKNYTRMQELSALFDETIEAFKAREPFDALMVKLDKMANLSSAITARHDVLIPTYCTLKGAVEEARAMHGPTVRDAGEKPSFYLF